MIETAEKNIPSTEQKSFDSGKVKILVTEHFAADGQPFAGLLKELILRNLKIAS